MHYRLIFNGKQLHGTRVLADYSIEHATTPTTLRLVLRLPKPHALTASSKSDGTSPPHSPSDTADEQLLCPITGLVYEDPVVDPAGNAYTRYVYHTYLYTMPRHHEVRLSTDRFRVKITLRIKNTKV